MIATLVALAVVVNAVLFAPVVAPATTATYTPFPGQLIAIAQAKPGPPASTALSDRLWHADQRLAGAILARAATRDRSAGTAAIMLQDLQVRSLPDDWKERMAAVLAHPDAEVRIHALLALREWPIAKPALPRSGDPLIARLEDALGASAMRERFLAIRCLAPAIDMPGVLERVGRLTDDPVADVRVEAVRAVSGSSRPEAIPFLLDRIGDRGRKVAGLALRDLGGRWNGLDQRQTTRLIEGIVRCLGEDGVERTALGAMDAGYAGLYQRSTVPASAALITALRAALADPDRQRRQLAGNLLMSFDADPPPELDSVAVEALADDAMPYGDHGMQFYTTNAFDAWDWLIAHPQRAGDLLERTLKSPDQQARSIAADILARRNLSGKPAITAGLLDAHDDGTGYSYRRRTTRGVRAFETLLRYEQRDRAVLVAALDSPGKASRFAAAVLLAYEQRHDLAERLVPILLPHLRDTPRLEGDAIVAVRALYLLGPACEPLIVPALASADAQQRALIGLLQRDWADPPKNLEAARRRSTKATRLSILTWDPAWEDVCQRNATFPTGTW